jgi:glutathione S-transferase
MGRVKQDIQVPYLEDPNTGAQLFESEAIVDYLNKHYG